MWIGWVAIGCAPPGASEPRADATASRGKTDSRNEAAVLNVGFYERGTSRAAGELLAPGAVDLSGYGRPACGNAPAEVVVPSDVAEAGECLGRRGCGLAVFPWSTVLGVVWLGAEAAAWLAQHPAAKDALARWVLNPRFVARAGSVARWSLRIIRWGSVAGLLAEAVGILYSMVSHPRTSTEERELGSRAQQWVETVGSSTVVASSEERLPHHGALSQAIGVFQVEVRNGQRDDWRCRDALKATKKRYGGNSVSAEVLPITATSARQWVERVGALAPKAGVYGLSRVGVCIENDGTTVLWPEIIRAPRDLPLLVEAKNVSAVAGHTLRVGLRMRGSNESGEIAPIFSRDRYAHLDPGDSGVFAVAANRPAGARVRFSSFSHPDKGSRWLKLAHEQPPLKTSVDTCQPAEVVPTLPPGQTPASELVARIRADNPHVSAGDIEVLEVVPEYLYHWDFESFFVDFADAGPSGGLPYETMEPAFFEAQRITGFDGRRSLPTWLHPVTGIGNSVSELYGTLLLCLTMKRPITALRLTTRPEHGGRRIAIDGDTLDRIDLLLHEAITGDTYPVSSFANTFHILNPQSVEAMVSDWGTLQPMVDQEFFSLRDDLVHEGKPIPDELRHSDSSLWDRELDVVGQQVRRYRRAGQDTLSDIAKRFSGAWAEREYGPRTGWAVPRARTLD